MDRKFPDCVGVIPARYDSKRFPGKPLVDLMGKPMFWHVYHRACRCVDLREVYLATDDERIVQAARAHEIPVLLTRVDHPSGTDRVMEAAEQLGLGSNTVVVNIQGDEPLLEPAMLSQLTGPFGDEQTQATTLAQPLGPDDIENPDRVKVVCSLSGRALYFSRTAIPFQDRHPQQILGHVGLYAFRLACLEQFVKWRPSPLERAERLEQLRLLEHDIPVQVVLTNHHSRSVDRPEDVKVVCEILKNSPQSSETI